MDYLWLKALHVISIIAWMAGLLYLPRLFVYHAQVAAGSETSEQFKIMERRLLNAITTPAGIASVLFGVWMLIDNPYLLEMPWMHAKLLCVFGLIISHILMWRWQRAFAADANRHGHRVFRIANEVPTLLMIVIVIMVIVQPF